MELFWIIVCYIVVLAVCFLVGEYLRDCRIAKKQRFDTQQNEPPVEVQPTPRQSVQMLSGQLADYFGLDRAELESFFTTHNAVIIDLEEQPPRE